MLCPICDAELHSMVVGFDAASGVDVIDRWCNRRNPTNWHEYSYDGEEHSHRYRYTVDDKSIVKDCDLLGKGLTMSGRDYSITTNDTDMVKLGFCICQRQLNDYGYSIWGGDSWLLPTVDISFDPKHPELIIQLIDSMRVLGE